MLGHRHHRWPWHPGLEWLGLRQSSLGPRWLLLHPCRSHPRLQMPTGTSGHGWWVHAHGRHGGHLRHLVLDGPLEDLHLGHLTLCLCCSLNLHGHFYRCWWRTRKGWLYSLRRRRWGHLAWRLPLGHRDSCLSPGHVGRHAVGRSGLWLRRGRRLRRLGGGWLLCSRRGWRGRGGGGQALLLPDHPRALHTGHPPAQHLGLLESVL